METQKQLDGLTDVVISANWLCKDDNDIVRTSGFVEFTPPQSGFVPYDQLTEMQVIQWVFNTLGKDKVFAIETALQAQIDYINNPPIVILPNPWV